MADLTKDLFTGAPKPQRPEDWLQLDYLATQLFTPHAPIDEEQLFAGRIDQVELLVDSVLQKGQHAILYGERGVGKTSLANLVKTRVLSHSPQYRVTKRNCTKELTFKQIWCQLLDDMQLDDLPLANELGETPGPYEVYKALDRFPINIRPIFIIDEYDRIEGDDTHIRMADTIKYISDNSLDVTIIIIGVADDVTQLFGGHPSIQRNVRQIAMPLMSENELHLLFDTRLRELGMQMETEMQQFIVSLSQGLPGYAHLLGQGAVRVAIERKQLTAEIGMMRKAMDRALRDCDERIQQLYETAVRSRKPNNLYRQAMLACAMAKISDRGYFTANDVRSSFSKIMGSERDFQTINRHLKEFCEDDRGPGILRVGLPRSYEYKLSDALLRPFVVIKGLTEGIITPEDL